MELILNGLDCPHCAEKIRAAVENHGAVKSAEMNFMTKRLKAELAEGADRNAVFDELTIIIKGIEPDVEPALYSGEKSGGMVMILEGLDCPDCGEKIRAFAEKLNGVESATLNFMSKRLEIRLTDMGSALRVRTAVTGFINTVEPDVKILSEGEKPKVKPESDIPKLMIVRLCTAAVFFALGMIFREKAFALWLFLSAYMIIGLDVILRALKNIAKGRPFDEYFLMTIASLGAFFVGEYPEGAAVMILYQLGETFQSYAVRRSRKSISELMDIRPDSADVKRDGVTVTVRPEEVAVGDIIVVKAGEKIPLDCVITSGESTADTAALTGESVPRSLRVGDEALSGFVNLSGLIEARVTKEYGQSTAAKILELVENSAAKKAKTENFITRFARVYTPCVVAAAVLLAVIPMIIQGGFSREFLYRALSFLVVSCPCALVISVPLSYFGGIGGASKRGILVKGGACFEQLSKCRTIVFDKTGTLTDGTFKVTEVSAADMSQQELIQLAAYAESCSNHPVAAAIAEYWIGDIPEGISAAEIAGKGVKAEFEGKVILAGNIKLMNENGISAPVCEGGGTVVYIAVDGKYSGYIRISDTVKPDSRAAIERLKKSGIRTVMLTGDRKEAAEAAAKSLGIDEYRAELLPDGKVACLEELMDGGVTAFVGDGINDAPVLTRADVGIAMGALGSDAAIEAADVVLMTDEPTKICEAISLSKRTGGIVMQNIIFAIGVKLIILLLTALGITSMWAAVFGDVGVAVLAVLNAMRARNTRNIK